MRRTRVLAPTTALTLLCCSVAAAQQKIYWGNEVPDGWNGEWPAQFQTIAYGSIRAIVGQFGWV